MPPVFVSDAVEADLADEVVEAVDAFIDEVEAALLPADLLPVPSVFVPQPASDAPTIVKLSANANILFIFIFPLLCEIYSTYAVIIYIVLSLFHIYVAHFFIYIAFY